MRVSVPRDAEITIVGGGAVGAAAAYFLARDGRRDVQLLEARGVCEATSSQAAGMVGQARPTVERARLTMAATQVYRDFERETGYSTDYRESGAVRLALSGWRCPTPRSRSCARSPRQPRSPGCRWSS